MHSHIQSGIHMLHLSHYLISYQFISHTAFCACGATFTVTSNTGALVSLCLHLQTVLMMGGHREINCPQSLL